MAEISSVAALRAIMGDPRESTRKKVLDHLDEQALAFLKVCPFAALATGGGEELLEVSPKGDVPGFVLVESSRSIVLPDRAGNNLAFGLENILRDPKIALLFLRPGTGETLRASGRATIIDDADVLDRMVVGKQRPKLAIRVAIDRAYFHCAKSVIRSGLWRPETWPERQKISFGRIIAGAMKADEGVSTEIDTRVDQHYRDVEAAEAPSPR